MYCVYSLSMCMCARVILSQPRAVTVATARFIGTSYHDISRGSLHLRPTAQAA